MMQVEADIQGIEMPSRGIEMEKYLAKTEE